MNKLTSKWRILPKLALTGVVKNGTIYYPYIGAGVFSVFTYFVFSSILHNDIIDILPRSAYVWMLLQIGRVLLGIILLLFTFYTNSFLMKRRKKEVGLYNILGLEKKHIGIMMFAESLFIYGIVMAAGVILGCILSKLLFLLLLRMTELPLDVSFSFSPMAVVETAVFFFVVYGMNFISNLIEVGKSKAAELLSGSRKGEKEPKFLWLYAALGIAVMGWGYRIAIISKVDSDIFLNFFLAVFLVILGTYLLFTSGSVAFLKILKKNRGIYYKSSNFITISGMLYRMKKNAASLVNICIFSTMVIITFTCTASVYLGLDDMQRHTYPFDVNMYYQDAQTDAEAVEEGIADLAEKHQVKTANYVTYRRFRLSCGKTEDSFHVAFSQQDKFWDNFKVNIMLAEEYNRIENRNVELAEDEIILFSSGADYGYDTVNFMGKELKVKEEPAAFRISSKAQNDVYDNAYYLIVKDENVYEQLVGAWAEKNGVEDMQGFLDSDYRVFRFMTEGSEEARKEMIEELNVWSQLQPGYVSFENKLEAREDNRSMIGGLIFIGILFGLVFMMCLLLIMYYKQVVEGYEDKDNFEIMQKVGMSDTEIRGTIRKQILLVFFLPLLGAILHTAAGMFMVSRLITTIRFYDIGLSVKCAIGVSGLFIFIYGLCYLLTAKTYYGIVRGGQVKSSRIIIA